MSTFLHHPAGLAALQRYRVDTGATNGTAAVISRVDPTTGIDGSIVQADAAGQVSPFLGAAATLYLRPVDARGGVGTAVASTGAAFPTAAPSAGGALDDDLTVIGTIDSTQQGVLASDGAGWAMKAYTALLTAIGGAPLASPALTGTPTAPTPSSADNTTKIATTAFVAAAITNVIASAPGALDTLNELAAALGNDANFAGTITNSLSVKAPLASPTFTGTPTAPTPSAGDNTTKLATTAYVQKNAQVVVNVKAYGAVGDDTTLDTSAVLAAHAAAEAVTSFAANGARVHYPLGTYKIDAAIPIGTNSITVSGDGFNSTCIRQITAGAHVFTATDKRQLVFRDLKLVGQGTGNGDGIYLAATGTNATFDCEFTNLQILSMGRHGVHTEDLCASSFRHVRVEGCGGDGFHLSDNGSSGLGGTSVTMASCFANACTGIGYYLDALNYSALTACATDNCGHGYQVNRSSGISLTACGVEDPAAGGHGFWVTNGSTSIDLTACWALRVSTTGIGFHVTQNSGSSCSRVIITAGRVLGSITPLASAKVDTACQAEFIGFQPHPSAGITGTGVMSFRAHDNTGLTSFGQAPASGDEPLVSWVASSSTYAYGASVLADTVRRWAVRGDGRLEWGTGALARDTNLYRHASGLRTDNTFIAANVNVGSPSGEAKCYITYADSQSTSIGLSMYETAGSQTAVEMIHLESTSASKRLLGAKVTGDSSNRLVALSSGQLLWGSGSSSLDTNLYRASADKLATDDAFSAADLQLNGVSIGGMSRPADQGMAAWAYDPAGATTASLATNGTLYLIKLIVNAAGNVTKLFWSIGTVGVTATSGQNWIGLYDSAGNRLVATGVDADVTAGGNRTTTLASTALSQGFVWAAMLFNASTAPSPLRQASGSSAPFNANLTAATYRFATNGTGLTSLPSTITPSSNAVGLSYWAAVAA